MKTKAKCYRCGKEFELDYKSLKQTLKCNHCNGYVTLDYGSLRKLKFVRMFITGIVTLALIVSMYHHNTMMEMAIFVVVAGLAMLFAFYADKLSLWLTANMFSLNYEEYHPENRKSKKRGK